MGDRSLATASVPVESLRLEVSVADIDAHPDRVFIWAAIRATREAMRREPHAFPMRMRREPHAFPTPVMG